MKPTGKFNPITGEEILKAELSDVLEFIHLKWYELTFEQKATFMSYRGYGFLSKQVEPMIQADYMKHQFKHKK